MELYLKQPGIPTQEDGYIPPKNWDGKKIQSTQDDGYGWPDAQGNLWVSHSLNAEKNAYWSVESLSDAYYTVYQLDTTEKNETHDELTLVCRRVIFYHRKDEAAFFEWIKKIECIDRIMAQGDEIYLQIACKDLHDHDLMDLIGLLYRYKIDMQQLKIFLTADNKKWFYDNKIAFWHKRVFGS